MDMKKQENEYSSENLEESDNKENIKKNKNDLQEDTSNFRSDNEHDIEEKKGKITPATVIIIARVDSRML